MSLGFQSNHDLILHALVLHHCNGKKQAYMTIDKTYDIMEIVKAPIKQFRFSTSTIFQTLGASTSLVHTWTMCMIHSGNLKLAGVMAQKTRSVHIAASDPRCDVQIRGGWIQRRLFNVAANCSKIHWGAAWEMGGLIIEHCFTRLTAHMAYTGLIMILANGHWIMKISSPSAKSQNMKYTKFGQTVSNFRSLQQILLSQILQYLHTIGDTNL